MRKFFALVALFIFLAFGFPVGVVQAAAQGTETSGVPLADLLSSIAVQVETLRLKVEALRRTVEAERATTNESSPAVAPREPSQSTPIRSRLARGARGNEVCTLQEILSRLGYFNASKTCYYGTVTEKAVKMFQRDRGLDPIGAIGPQTREAFAIAEAPQYAQGSILVALKSGVSVETLRAFDIHVGTQSKLLFPGKAGRLGRTYRISFLESRDPNELKRLYAAKKDLVEFAELNYTGRTQQATIPRQPVAPNDPLYPQEWHLSKIKAPEAWNITKGDPSVVIAVIDTGVKWNHPDLAANIWSNSGEIAGNGIDDDANGYIDDVRGWDFVTGYPPNCFVSGGWDCDLEDNDPSDAVNHGTHVAGIIAGVSNNNLGIASVCRNCRIMPVRAAYASAKSSGTGAVTASFLYDHLVEAIIYAADNGAKIINMSLGGTAYSQVLADAVAYAAGRGAAMVASAGDGYLCGSSICGGGSYISYERSFYPASFPEVISVAATDAQDIRAEFSNYNDSYTPAGGAIDVAAPGVGIWSTSNSNASLGCQDTGSSIGYPGYTQCNGTSMAAGEVSGVLGLVLAKTPGLSPTQLSTLLHITSDPVSQNPYIGFGRVNALKALTQYGATSPSAVLSSEKGYNGSDPIVFRGTAAGGSFASWTLEYGSGFLPANWNVLVPPTPNQVSNGTLFTWNTVSANLPIGIYTVRLTVLDTSGKQYRDYAFLYIDTTLSAGWPKQLPPFQKILGTPTAADIQGDGSEELFQILSNKSGISYNQEIYGFNPDLTVLPGFPYIDTTSDDATHPTIANLDGAGGPEIVYIGNFPPRVTALNSDGTLRWSQTLPIPQYPIVVPAPIIANLDGGSDLEVVVAAEINDPNSCQGWQGRGEIYAFKADGQTLSGYPISVPCPINVSSFAVGDIDNNGDMEIAIVGAANIYVYEHTGAAYPGWPKVWAGTGHLALGDIDQNDGGKLEIVSTLSAQATPGGVLNVFNHDGTTVFTRTLSYEPSPATFGDLPLGDVNSDGFLDIIVRTRQELLVYDHTGAVLSGFPVTWSDTTYPNALYPLLADVDNDGKSEIVVVRADRGTMYAYRFDGTIEEHFPKTLDYFPSGADIVTLASGDLDGDGKTELFAIDSQGTAYNWEFASAPGLTTLPWPMYRQNASHTGQVLPPPDLFPPIVTIIQPPDGYTFSSGTVNVQATAVDASGITNLKIFLNSVQKFNCASSPCGGNINANQFNQGANTITAEATDGAVPPNTGFATPVTVFKQ